MLGYRDLWADIFNSIVNARFSLFITEHYPRNYCVMRKAMSPNLSGSLWGNDHRPWRDHYIAGMDPGYS
jgi:hypothetical protein